MSRWLRDALEFERQYVQNPMDDLQSFMWTALWATVYNPLADDNAEEQKWQTNEWRTQLRNREDIGRGYVLSQVLVAEFMEPEHALLVRRMSPLFRQWQLSVAKLAKKFRSV